MKYMNTRYNTFDSGWALQSAPEYAYLADGELKKSFSDDIERIYLSFEFYIPDKYFSDDTCIFRFNCSNQRPFSLCVDKEKNLYFKAGKYDKQNTFNTVIKGGIWYKIYFAWNLREGKFFLCFNNDIVIEETSETFVITGDGVYTKIHDAIFYLNCIDGYYNRVRNIIISDKEFSKNQCLAEFTTHPSDSNEFIKQSDDVYYTTNNSVFACEFDDTILDKYVKKEVATILQAGSVSNVEYIDIECGSNRETYSSEKFKKVGNLHSNTMPYSNQINIYPIKE